MVQFITCLNAGDKSDTPDWMSNCEAYLKEKGLRDEDPFDEIAARSLVIDLDRPAEFEDIVRQVSKWLSERVPHTVDEIEKQLLDRTHIGSTPVTHGVGLPHLRIDGIEHCEMVLVRSLPGIHIQFADPLTGHEVEAQLTAIFFLFSPEHDPSQHLRILAQIARRADDENFLREWHAASDEVELKEALLHDEAFLLLTLRRDPRDRRPHWPRPDARRIFQKAVSWQCCAAAGAW